MSKVKANTVDGSEEKQAAIRELIAIFLQLNPEAADEQVHQLAAALAVDKEALESVFYGMLGDAVGGDQVSAFVIQAARRMHAGLAEVYEDGAESDVGLSQDTKVRQGDYDENEITVDQTMINDGELSMDDPDTGFQEETRDDGVIDEDSDLGNGTSTKDLLINDGTPDLEI